MSDMKITTKKRALQDVYNIIINENLSAHEKVSEVLEYITHKYPEFAESDYYNYDSGYARGEFGNPRSGS